MGIVANFPQNFPNERMDFAGLKDEEMACPIFRHRDLGTLYIHNLDGTMRESEAANMSREDKETLRAYAVISSD